MVQSVPEYISFPKEEEKILEFWTKIDAFKTSLKQSENKPAWVFEDGPPFASGLPHYGHILAGTIKDIVTRWAHQSGYHVERRFGWDCHGLPIEYEIDKTLGIKGPDDVKKMGIAAYNAECRKIVSRYAEEWRFVVNRMARWIDFDNDYKTMYPWFMESVWWAFKQLYVKSLVYRGVKVMPYSTQCNTPLSNFESGQNYKEVVDPAVIVNFPLLSDRTVSLVAWTTTPWTLPSNLALCVNPNSTYVKIECVKSNKKYIIMESRVSALFKKPADYKVIEKMQGKQLEGQQYVPLFDYFVEKMKPNGAFRVLTDTYVTEESGTGIVHQAPYFGEDDHRVCLANKIIFKDGSIVCPVDESGRFTSDVTHFAGLYVKDADKEIIKHLKKADRLVNAATVKHNYPFCWRSDTPLIYKAVPSWFVKVEQMSAQLLKNNAETYWVPDFVKEKRFGNWLKDARDWAISRNRYWGTPIPLWISDDGEEIICVGSIQELEELSGQKITDLHREFVDPIEIPSKMGKGNLKRVSEVFDCWFESGSMPYAQRHYPFENKQLFEKNFPADFIAEGIDQTRGWFYTLLVLSTALFNKPPFKNLIANGMVLASDGQKMSKRKKNYPDPMKVVESYGADALRLYLVNSPVVRAENLRFKEEGVRDVLKDCFLPWYNAYRFLIQNIELYSKETNEQFKLYSLKRLDPVNFMDKWILSFTQSLVKFVKAEMKVYHLYTVTPKLVKFIDNLTNWYVRMNRKRFRGEFGKEDSYKALETLASVLTTMVQLMAPFTPYLTELMYQNLKNLYIDKVSNESVHYLMLPDVQEFLIDEQVEQCVNYMQTIVDVGRVIRDRRTLPLKYPLPEAIIICKDQAILDQVKLLENYILEELNIKRLVLTTEKAKYGVKLKAEPNTKNLGIRLRNKSKEIAAAIKNLNEDEIEKFVENPTEFTVCGDKLEVDDIRVEYTFAGDLSGNLAEQYEADADGQFLILLDVRPDSSMLDEGVAREVVNRIQKLRKKAHLVPTDQIEVYYDLKDECELKRVIKTQTEFIVNSLKAPLNAYPLSNNGKLVIEEDQELKDVCFKIGIIKLNDNESSKTTEQKNSKQSQAKNQHAIFSPILHAPPHKLILSPKQQQQNIMLPLNVSTIIDNSLLAKSTNLSPKLASSGCGGSSSSTISGSTTNKMILSNKKQTLNQPFCSFVNVELLDSMNVLQNKATILLEQPVDQNVLTKIELIKLINHIFNRNDINEQHIYNSIQCVHQLSIHDNDIISLNGNTLFIKI